MRGLHQKLTHFLWSGKGSALTNQQAIGQNDLNLFLTKQNVSTLEVAEKLHIHVTATQNGPTVGKPHCLQI
jgi:hypothetical protein